jgi:hypothetical protein
MGSERVLEKGVGGESGELPYWHKEVGRVLDAGLSVEDLEKLGEDIGIERINVELLPGKDTVWGKARDRKEAVFRCAEAVWGIEPSKWLEFEATALARQRKISGSQAIGGKRGLLDVVSAELAVRILAACKIVREFGVESITACWAVRGLI